jgi:alpha-beta hydrolase superfamily lysophospholipase
MNLVYEGSFLSEADDLPISVLAVYPQEKPYRAIVQLVHGMSEHKERYLPFMHYLAEQGYFTIIHDHRGHGKSVKSKADFGYMYGGGAEAILKDIESVNRQVREEIPGIPLVLFGHSMGSLAVRAFAAKHDDCMDMLIVCGSPGKNPARPLGELIAHGEKAVLGARHKSHLLEALSFGSYVMRFKDDKNCTAWICSDKEVAREYETSELCGFTFTDDGYLTLFELMKQAYDVKHWNCGNPKLPILFVSGAEDPCMGGVRSFARAVQNMRHAGYLDVKGKLYPGMRHEILNETEKQKVYRDIVVYIRKKI